MSTQKSGGKTLKGYRLHLTKSSVEDITGFNVDTKVNVIYEKGKITIIEQK